MAKIYAHHEFDFSIDPQFCCGTQFENSPDPFDYPHLYAFWGDLLEFTPFYSLLVRRLYLVCIVTGAYALPRGRPKMEPKTCGGSAHVGLLCLDINTCQCVDPAS